MIVQGRDYEHTLAFPPVAHGVPLEYRPGDAAALARTVLAGDPFEVAEFSLSAAMILAGRASLPFSLIPVFPARSFVHSYLFVRTDSALHTLADLRGATIGMRDFASTGAVWFRGLLAEAGVDWRGIRWVTGPKARFAPPPGARIEPSAADPEQMLLDNEIDMFFSARVKDARRPADQRRTRWLLPDPAAAEAAWFTETGIYPMIHAVAVSAATTAAIPAAAQAAFQGYGVAKRAALARKLGSTMMPGAETLWERAAQLFGPDPLPYGLTGRNARAVGLMGQYLAEQGFVAAAPDAASVFHPGSAAWRED